MRMIFCGSVLISISGLKISQWILDLHRNSCQNWEKRTKPAVNLDSAGALCRGRRPAVRVS